MSAPLEPHGGVDLVFSQPPEEIQQRDTVHIALRFTQMESWYWFDGDKLWERSLSAGGDGIPVTLTAVRNQ